MLILLLMLLPTALSQFHLFIVISCESYCHVTFKHHEMEYYSIMEHSAQIARHFEEPVPTVTFQIDYFYNTTDFMPVTTMVEWAGYLNKTLFFDEDGVRIIAHYFCPESRCLVDNTRLEYKETIEQWSLGLVLIGIFFFLLISGAIDAMVKWIRNKFSRRMDEPYNTVELTDMSKRI